MTADEFNTAHPIGTPVLAFPGSREGRVLFTRTRTPAWTLGRHAVVAVDGYAGGIALTHVEVVPADYPSQEAPAAEVEAAARALWAMRWSTPWDEYSAGRGPARPDGTDLRAVQMRRAQAALSAARAARRDEEKR